MGSSVDYGEVNGLGNAGLSFAAFRRSRIAAVVLLSELANLAFL